MRATNDRPRPSRRVTRRRIGLLAAAVVVIILIFSLRGISGFYTDYLWFGSVGLTSVWKGVVATKVWLAVVFTAVFFLAMWADLLIADRLAPEMRVAGGPEDEFVQRYRAAVGPHVGKVRISASLVLGLLVGTGAASQWNKWILFRHSVSFHQVDPQFHRDIGFFVFRLPFYQFLVSWGFVALIVITIVTVAAHYLNGGIRLQVPSNRVTPQVKLHLSVLLGCIALLKAVGYYLQRFELDFSSRGVVNGATYTDVHAQLPALTLLILISLVAFVLFIYNTRQQGWVLPVIGVGLWAFVSIIVGAVYPWFIQKFRVQPAEASFEKPYIKDNIAATRAAYKLNNVKVTDYPYNTSLSATDLARDASTVRNIRLWEPPYATQAYQKLQEIKSYYTFPGNVGIDRYNIGGAQTQTIMAVRQINPSDLPSQTWVTSHLQYTHGYGAILSPANANDPNGQPVFDISDIPPVSKPGSPAITQPQVYFGAQMPGYVVADTSQPELDYQTPTGANVNSSYHGSGGVQMGSVLRRAALALRFGDVNLLISGQISSHSRVLFYRDVQQRVSKAAPFLSLDADPYPAIVGGRMVWVQDAYTTTNNYPYSQQADTSNVNPNSGLTSNFNYVRNSVKVVIDAYNGSMKFYVTDPSDPIIQSYEKAFPKLFTTSPAPAAIQAHFRYPEDLFSVQTAMYGRYHITRPGDFYTAANAWNISQSSGQGPPNASLNTVTTNAAGQLVEGPPAQMSPQYLLMRLPGQSDTSFIELQAYVPRSPDAKQQNLSAFMVALNDPGHYGQLEVFQMPPNILVDGPALVDARIAANPAISQEISLLNQNGSAVQLGSVLVIPVQSSLIYVRPLYVESSRTQLPELEKVIVVSGGQSAMENTLQQALIDLFGNAPRTQEQKQGVTNTAPPPTTGPALTPAAQAALNQAAAYYQQAQADLKAGNLGAYQQDVTNMGNAITAAGGAPSAATGGSGSSGSSTSPGSTTPSSGAPGSTTTTTAPGGGST